MIGTPEFAGLNTVPNQPAKPSVVQMTKPDNHRHRSGHRAQQSGGGNHNDQEDKRRQGFQVIRCRLGERASQGNITREMECDVGMVGTRLFKNTSDMVGDFDHGGIRVLGQGKTDHQTAHPAVARNQPAGDRRCIQRNFPDPRQVGILKCFRIADQGLDDQIVLPTFAVEIVGQRIDPGAVGYAPPGVGQLLDRAEHLSGEHCSLPGCDGNQRRIRCSICALEAVERRKLRIVVVEQATVIVGNPDESCAHGDRKHECRGESDNIPSAAQDEGGVLGQVHRATLRSGAFHAGAPFGWAGNGKLRIPRPIAKHTERYIAGHRSPVPRPACRKWRSPRWYAGDEGGQFLPCIEAGKPVCRHVFGKRNHAVGIHRIPAVTPADRPRRTPWRQISPPRDVYQSDDSSA